MKYENLTKKELLEVVKKLESENTLLQSEKEEITGRLETIHRSEHRYRMIFDHSDISLWEEDYSQVFTFLDKLRKEGISDFKSYLYSHPEAVSFLIKKIKILNINPATLTLYNAKSREEFLGSLENIFVPESVPYFINEVSSIARGATHFEGETLGKKVTGEMMNLVLRITIPEEGRTRDYTNVLVAIIDITEQKQREQEYLQMLQLADSLRTTSLALTSTMNRDKILDIILEESRKAVPFTAVIIALKEGNYIRVVRYKGLDPFQNTGTQLESILNHPEVKDVRIMERTGRPVLISNTDTEPDWTYFEATDWVRSYLGMPITVRNRIIGFVLFYSNEPHMFSEKNIQFIDPFVFSAGIALENAGLFSDLERELAEKKEAEKIIRSSLEEKKILLMEIHHRVKNNLNIVASLLNLQSDQIETVEQARNALQMSQSRIHSMALIHENLYQSEDLAHIDIAEYIRRMSHELVHLYTTDTSIDLSVDAHKAIITINQAVPLGMLLNELITNAITHAFPGRTRGSISIQMHEKNDRELEFTISDNGIGIPEDINPGNTPSLGLQLVNILTSQLDGSLAIIRDHGTTIRISFPREKPEAKR